MSCLKPQNVGCQKFLPAHKIFASMQIIFQKQIDICLRGRRRGKFAFISILAEILPVYQLFFRQFVDF